MLWGDGIWETWDPLQRERAVYLPRLGLATRMAELEALAEAQDRDDRGWLVVAEVAKTLFERYDNDFNQVTVAAGALFANDSVTINGLYDSVPGMTAAARLAVVEHWLDTLTAGLLGSRVEERRLFAYGFAVAVLRELVLVNLGHGTLLGEGVHTTTEFPVRARHKSR